MAALLARKARAQLELQETVVMGAGGSLAVRDLPQIILGSSQDVRGIFRARLNDCSCIFAT